jgi:CheY-like chemotaxis protein
MEPNGLARGRLGPPPLVLLVVDDQDARQRYAEALLLARNSVTAAQDPSQALERAVALAPDVVLVDLRSPALDGLDFYHRLRADRRTHDLPAVVVTPHTADETACSDEHVLFVTPSSAELLADGIRSVLERLQPPSDEPLLFEVPQTADERILMRVRGEYLEMPGLRLTLPQARRLWGMDVVTCERILQLLVDANFLSVRSDGTYARASEGEQTPPPRRMLKATLASSTAAPLRRRERS